MTTATKGGQHKEMLDRIMRERLDPVGVETAPEEEMTLMRLMNVFW